MGTILKHTVRSVKEHLGQPMVIIFTVAVTTMLLFASLTIEGLFYNFQLANASRVAGEADISVTGGLFSGARLDEYTSVHSDEIEYVEKYLSSVGVINSMLGSGEESTAVIIEATDLQAFRTLNKSKLIYFDGIGNASYTYPEIWIGRGLSNEIGCAVGDEVDIYVGFYGRYETFTVTHIFEDKGFFGNTTVYNVLTDLSSIGDKGLYTEAYIKLKKSVDKTAFADSLNVYMDNAELKIGNAIDYEYIENVVSDNERLLQIALIFVIALVVFILFGAYTVITKKRSEEMLVFKAVGAAPGQLLFMLFAEVGLYGLIGGIIGTVFGRFGMELAVKTVIPEFGGAVVYKIWHYATALFFGIAISVIGASVPIIKLIKNSVRNQAANSSKIVRRVNPIFVLIAVTVFALSAIGIAFLNSYALIFTVILIASFAFAIVAGAPFLMSLISFLIGRAGGTVRVAATGIKRNSEAVSLSCLLGAVMAFTFITFGIVGVIIDASKPVNSRFNADYAVQSISGKTNPLSTKIMLENTFGISEAFLIYYEKTDFVFNGRKTDITVYAVDSASDLGCVCDLTEGEIEWFNNEESSAVVSYDLLSRLGIKIGEKITLGINGREYEFTAIACENSKTANDRVVFINKNGCDYGFSESYIFFNVNKNISHSDLYAEVKEKSADYGCFVFRFDKWANAANVGVDGISLLLRLLQIVVGVVGFAGLVNMIISMMMTRERELSIYSASGMDEMRHKLFLLTEGAVISLTGVVIGSIVAVTVNALMPTFAKMIDRYVGADYGMVIPIIAIAAVALFGCVYFIIGLSHKLKKIKINKNAI